MKKNIKFVPEEVDLDFISEDKILRSIELNFPNLSEREVSTASLGSRLRNMLSEEKQIELFPTKNELQNILAKTIAELLDGQNFELLKSNKLKRKTKDYIDEVGFYYVKGSFDPTYSKRFLWLEKLVMKWCKENEILAGRKFQFLMYYPLRNKFVNSIQFNSYLKLANRFYPRVKYLIEELIPEFETLTDIGKLNERINYGNQESDRFNGYKRSWSGDKRIIMVNPIVSILSGDQNYEEIIKKEVLNHLEDSEKEKYFKAFEKLKQYGA